MSEQSHAEALFDVYAACYAYAVEFHSGQWSRSYALLSFLARKGFRPGLSLERDLHLALDTERSIALYNHLCAIGY